MEGGEDALARRARAGGDVEEALEEDRVRARQAARGEGRLELRGALEPAALLAPRPESAMAYDAVYEKGKKRIQ